MPLDLARAAGRDQEAGDDEEHVDADEPAGEVRHIGVEREDREDGDRAQPLDVTAEAARAPA